MTLQLKIAVLFGFLIAACALTTPVFAQDPQSDRADGTATPAAPSAPQSILPGAVGPPAPMPEENTGPVAPAADGMAASPLANDTGGLSPALPADLPLAPITADVGSGGPLPAGFGTGTDSWVGAQGGYSTELMRRLEAPLASRYGHILLRRLLMTKASPPAGADPLQFITARAHLLLRMGEVEAAKMVIETVPLSVYDRRLYTVAAQTHLAAIDIAATCPLAQKAIVFSPDTQWPLLSAICSALQGDDGGAALGLDIAQQGGKVNKFDLFVAEQAVTAVAGGGRSGQVAWPEHGRFTSYRIGATYASGQSFPESALLKAPAAVQAWLARSAFVDPETRYKLGWTAAALGTLSSDEFISGWSARGSGLEPRVLAYRPEGLLQKATLAPTTGQRYAAMRQLWAMGKSERGRMAMWLITSDAAARFPLIASQSAIAPDLLRSMLMGGRLKEAARWAPVLQSVGGDALTTSWPLIFLADPRALQPNDTLVEGWLNAQSGDGDKRRKQMLVASLEAFGRLGDASISRSSKPDDVEGVVFAKLIDAVRRHARGEVVVLGALAMGHSWSAVTPGILRAVLSAYRAVGLERDARLIAAEAIIMAGG